MQGNGEFKVVTYRKKRVGHVRSRLCTNASVRINDEGVENRSISCDTVYGRILDAEVEVKNSLFADNVFHSLNDSLSRLNFDRISDILCYGLGHFSNNKSAMYQLALLLSVKRQYGSVVHIYDPVFSLVEVEVLRQLEFNVIEKNEEGKRVIGDIVTLVYMPHCSIHLIDNFLYANWCRKLSNCILLTNSFSIVADNTTGANGSIPTDYIRRVLPYVTEIVLTNNFRHEEAFNDLNVHIFLEQDIDKIPKSFWSNRKEPCYRDREIDYFTANETEETTTRC